MTPTQAKSRIRWIVAVTTGLLVVLAAVAATLRP